MAARTGLARALSKLGYCSRSQAIELIRAGNVQVNGRLRRDPEFPVRLGSDVIDIQGAAIEAARHVYLMLNKPRGMVTTTRDEKGRETVFACFEGEQDLPAHLVPVGRLDKASEGLLLFTNDNAWAAAITDPATHLDKTYHVQIKGQVDEACLARLQHGVMDEGERLTAKAIRTIRAGTKTCWLEIILDEGRNRQIRRLLGTFDLEVLRLIRIAIGTLTLGDLPKGQWRELTEEEVVALRRY